MVRLLKNADMEGLLEVEELIDPMERGFREHGEGVSPDVPRRRLYMPVDDETGYFLNNIMGGVAFRHTAAIRIDSDLEYTDREREGSPAESFTGVVLLFDTRSADLVGIVDDHFLSTRRVAATSAVGARHLARADSTRLGLFGTGEQAQTQLRAFCHEFDLTDVSVYSPTEDHRERFAAWHDRRAEPSVVAVSEPRAVVEGADVVVTATNANDPVFDGEWLEPGTHVSTTVGGDYRSDRDEIDATTVERADRIVCTRYGQLVDDEQGHLYAAIADGRLGREDVAELGEVVAGAAPGRTADDEITLMKNNTGMGLQFAVAGSMVLERAETARHTVTDSPIYDGVVEGGIGTVLPREWFTTDFHGDESWSH